MRVAARPAPGAPCIEPMRRPFRNRKPCSLPRSGGVYYNSARGDWRNRNKSAIPPIMHGLPIFLFAAVATLMALSILIVAQVLGPRRRSAVKEMPYESGMDPIHSARHRFNVTFYLLAIEF